MKLPRSPFLYPILDSSFSTDLVQDALASVRAGVRILQLRAKNLPHSEVYRMVEKLVPVCEQAGVCLIVNDYVDIACVTGAAGVHLGQDDFPCRDARSLLGDKIIGVSTHNTEQLSFANRLPVDYIAIGPVYETQTKPGANAALGPIFVQQARKQSRYPLVCIGGITQDKVVELLKSGADGIAMISEIYRGPDVFTRVRRLLPLFH